MPSFENPKFFHYSVIPYTLLLLSISVTPWNGSFLMFLRLNDILILSAFLFSMAFLRVSKYLIIALFTILFVLLLSVMVNIGSLGGGEVERLAFVYKYIMPIIAAVPLIATINSGSRLYIVQKVLFLVYLVMVGWVYYYKAAVDSGSIIGLARLSFPGSDDFLVSDAHLYSNYLSMGLVFYIFFLKKTLDHRALVSTAVILASVGAMVLTFSRNGLVIFGFSIIFYAFLSLLAGRASPHYKSLVSLFVLFLAAILGFSIWAEVIVNYTAEAVDRAFNFDFSIDPSAIGRLEKFLVAVSDWSAGSVFFGAGIFGSSLIWYDSGVGIILAHMGLVGILYIFGGLSFLVFIVVKRYGLEPSGVRAFITILTGYIISNGITEFALVTRSALPVTLYIITPVIYEKIRLQ